MLYSTIVKRDETCFNSILEAAREFEEENVLEAIIACKFDQRKLEQTLNLVRYYQLRLNNESLDLIPFSEHFIEEYATDNNECFKIAKKLVKRIGTTITGSMKIFRKFCPVVRRKLEGGNIVPALDYSRLTFRQFHGQFFGVEVYTELVKTVLHEMATFFYHLMSILKICNDMIRQEELTRSDYNKLSRIFDKSCENVLGCMRDIYDTFGNVKIVSEEEMKEIRKNARPKKEWLAKDYHKHDKKWLTRQAVICKCCTGAQYGLDETASMQWVNNPGWGKKVCEIIPKLDSLHIPFKHDKKAEAQGKKGKFDSREMVYLIKWSQVSHMSDEGNEVIDEVKEKKFYLYLQKEYQGEYAFPSWQSVCRERTYLYNVNISNEEMAKNFAQHLSDQKDVA